MSLVKIKDDLYIPEDFAKDHNYYADPAGTKPYTGVTSVLSVLAKPALIGWAAKMAVEHIMENISDLITGDDTERLLILEEAKKAHTKKKEAAGVHGTDAHALVEKYIKQCIEESHGIPLTMLPWVSESIRPFMDWAISNVDHFLFSERRMCDPTHFIAGTADFAAVMKDGKKLMGDFKTSSGIYGIDYWLQVAAYRMLAEGEGDEPYDGFVVARLGKDGKFEAKYLYEYETFRDAFLACLTLYRAQDAIKGLISK